MQREALRRGMLLERITEGRWRYRLAMPPDIISDFTTLDDVDEFLRSVSDHDREVGSWWLSFNGGLLAIVAVLVVAIVVLVDGLVQ